MAAFHYIALSQDGKELSGIIEAADDTMARTKLNGLGLSIVSLETTLQVSSNPTHPSKITFQFTAFDKNKKKVVGTIAATDATEAYSRLFSEYQLDVTSLSSNGEELNLNEIQSTYQKLHNINSLQSQETIKVDPERQSLLTKVDFTMNRVREFLKLYGPDLKLEEREIIQSYMNQLIRIKDSTNLEHIRVTCEKMLDHIQRQELFMYEEQRTKESTQIKVETRELLSSLKSRGLKQDIDLTSMLSKIQTISFLKPIADVLLKLMNSHTPEIRQARMEIKALNNHIWEYVRLLLTWKNPVLRREAWQTIKTLLVERKRLKNQLQGIIEEEKLRSAKPVSKGKIEEHIKSGLGWIFGAYAIFYIISYPATIKNLPIKLPNALYFYSMSLPKYFLIFCLLFYASMQLRHLFFPTNKWSKIILYPGTLFMYLLILINLM